VGFLAGERRRGTGFGATATGVAASAVTAGTAMSSVLVAMSISALSACGFDAISRRRE
jgi:hypothetical protein